MNYNKQQKKAYDALKNRLVAYMMSVQSIYDNISAQAANIALNTDYDGTSDDVFSFSDYPEQRTAIQKMQNDFVSELSSLIDRGVTKEWQMSNEAQNLLINTMVESAGVRLNNFYQKKFWQYNDEALNAFKSRKDKGMGLSTKIWTQSSNLKIELEDAISVAIQRGTSAVTLSKRISQYLQNYPSLKRDYGEKFGTAIRSRDCQYASVRLARTEINMSYRMAEQERWRNLDFVLGYTIKLSNNHTCKGVINFVDICDDLAGDYPKDFVWAGWHPSCRCYAVPKLMSEAEFEKFNLGEPTTEKPITEMPKQFNEWLTTNADRIENAQERGTLPYFLKDNKSFLGFTNIKKDGTATKLGRADKNAALEYYSYSKPLVLSDTLQKNISKVAEEMNIELTPMNFIQANERNANICRDLSNCQTCVAVFEARLRGLPITSKPFSIGGVQEELSEYFQNIWINPKTNEIPQVTLIKSDKDNFLQRFENSTNAVGRYNIGINYKNNTGHVISAERLSNGKIIYYDPQNGTFLNIKDLTNIESFEVLKIDKLIFNIDKLKQISLLS